MKSHSEHFENELCDLSLTFYYNKLSLGYLDIKYLVVGLYLIVQSIILIVLIVGYLVAAKDK